MQARPTTPRFLPTGVTHDIPPDNATHAETRHEVSETHKKQQKTHETQQKTRIVCRRVVSDTKGADSARPHMDHTWPIGHTTINTYHGMGTPLCWQFACSTNSHSPVVVREPSCRAAPNRRATLSRSKVSHDKYKPHVSDTHVGTSSSHCKTTSNSQARPAKHISGIIPLGPKPNTCANT